MFPAPSALPLPHHPSNRLFFLSSFAGRDDHHTVAQCGRHSALCHQCGQEHHVCHDTPLVGHLLPDAFHRFSAGLHSLCSLPPQWTVGIALGLTVPWASFLSGFLRTRLRSEIWGRHFLSNMFKCINRTRNFGLWEILETDASEWVRNINWDQTHLIIQRATTHGKVLPPEPRFHLLPNSLVANGTGVAPCHDKCW